MEITCEKKCRSLNRKIGKENENESKADGNSCENHENKMGICNIKAKRFWLNTELAKKPIEYIEYVLVHEMTHLLERNHNDKFVSYMNKFSPNWKHIREELNRLPLGHVEWGKIQ